MENLTLLTEEDKNKTCLPVYVSDISEKCLKRGENYRFMKPMYSLLYCVRGELLVKSNQMTRNLKCGKVLFAEPYKEYLCSVIAPDCLIKWIVLGGSGIAQIVSYFDLSGHHMYHLDVHYFELQFKNILTNIRQEKDFLASIALQQVVYEMSRGEHVKRSENIEYLNRFVHENYCSEIDNQKLADVLGTSVSYLCRIFKTHYHMSPMAYVMKLRMEKAKELLVTSHKKVSVIAAECGFSNPEYFCYVFKKHENCTPLEYRNVNLHTYDKAE